MWCDLCVFRHPPSYLSAVPAAAMAAFSASPPPNLRVFAKVARAAPSGEVAAVVRFNLRVGGARPPQCGPLRGGASPAPAAVQQTFQFSELRAFLEAGRARAAVAGMLSLLPLELETGCFQAMAGFISSVLVVAASRSVRRNLGGVIGIVRIDGYGAAKREGGGDGGAGDGDGLSSGSPPPDQGTHSKASDGGDAGEGGGGVFGGSGCCPICYESLGSGATTTTTTRTMTTPCGHGFHAACIGRWLRSRPTCPVCRLVMPPEKDMKAR